MASFFEVPGSSTSSGLVKFTVEDGGFEMFFLFLLEAFAGSMSTLQSPYVIN